MKLAGREAETFAAKPKPSIWGALIFGEDDGVVADTAGTLIANWCETPATDVQTFEDDAVRSDPASLFDALEARSLLGGDHVVRVRTRGDKIAAHLIKVLETGNEGPDRFGAKLVITADALRKKSKLRTGFEASRTAAALQVFTDSSDDIAALITSTLTADNLSIDPDALGQLAATLPGHRALARAEIEKLALYGRGLSRPLLLDDIRALSASDIDHAVSDLVTATLSGDTSLALTELDRLDHAGTSPITVLRALQREADRMIAAHGLIGGGSANIGMKLRPPVWQSEWAGFQTRLRKWPVKRLAAVLERIYDAEQMAKSAGPAASPALRVLVWNLSKAAG